ncbi:MAG: glycosyltransferase family 4 protein [Candidatus Omnitrophica bacterium]|nr:glycosyltransferase family 4 protein [Candidatus Omnitrophota bacterium]
MSKIDILYVITKLELGGAQKQLLELIRNLDKEKYRVHLFTAKKALLIKEAESIKDLALIKSRYLERTINPFKDTLAFIELYFFIRKNRFQIVHTHSSKAGILGRLAAKVAGVKNIIHTVHGWSFHRYQNKIIYRLFLYLERMTALFTTKIIVVSNYDREKGLEYKIGTPDKYVLINYGIDYSEFKRKPNLELKDQLRINRASPVIGMIACFKPQKGIFDFVKVAQRVSFSFPEVRFILVGDGVLRAKIEKFIQKLNLEKRIILLGWRRDIPNILSIIDVFVLTSLWEGMPISVLEAKVSEKPVVVTDTGGVSEIIKDSIDGFLVPCGNIDLISEKILILLKDKELRESMGKKAWVSLNHKFSLISMMKEIEHLYSQIIKS